MTVDLLIIETVSVAGQTLAAGVAVALPDDVAAALVASGAAVRTDSPDPAPTQSPRRKKD